MSKKFSSRVDVQVAVFVALIIAFCGVIISTIVFTISYSEMINVLKQSAWSIDLYIDENIDADIFTDIKTKEDMVGEQYEQAYTLLNEVRDISGAKYLYTATVNDKGELIYHVDGLPIDDVDFRYVGDLIEPEFQESLTTALTGVEILPEKILSTEWGHVYVAYFPLHDKDGNVVSALGIEFYADSQFDSFNKIGAHAIIAIVVTCIIAGIVSRKIFKRISNPHYKDIYNTDSLTKIKNRNAFDTDVHNIIQRSAIKDVILVLTDLNGLKTVNDNFGHKMGDFYIDACAKALVLEGFDDFVVYRIGGDEFATIIPPVHSNIVEEYIKTSKQKLVEICGKMIPMASVAMGYAVCEGSEIEDWEKTHQKADKFMYADKKKYYEQNKSQDMRR